MDVWKYSLAILAALATALVAGTAYNKLPEHALEEAKRLGALQTEVESLQEKSKEQSQQLDQQQRELIAALDRAQQSEDSLKDLETSLVDQKRKAASLSEELGKLVEEVTGADGIGSQDKLNALREFVEAIQGNQAGATLLKLQNDVSEVRNRKPPGSSINCKWMAISNASGGHAEAHKGKLWRASCPSGMYMKSFGLKTWEQLATYHHEMECCEF